jgi:phage shock protein A
MFKRLTLSLKAKFSRLLDRGEDPAEILDYTYERQLEQLHGMRRDVADLARQALERKRLVGQELVDLNQQVSELEHQQAQMVARGREARARVERFRSRKEVTKAQYAAAKAHVAISEAVAGISSQLREAGLTIERTMDRVDDMNVRAGAMEELESAGTFAAVGAGEDDIDRQLRELSSGGASIDAEISRLRLELNRGKSSRPPN